MEQPLPAPCQPAGDAPVSPATGRDAQPQGKLRHRVATEESVASLWRLLCPPQPGFAHRGGGGGWVKTAPVLPLPSHI